MINLELFCAGNGFYQIISRPFSLGEYTYATDGHILARVTRQNDVPELDAPPTDAQLDTLKKVDAAPEQWYHVVYKSTPGKTCPSCGGIYKERNCPECGAIGTLEFENNYHTYTVTCETCDGSGVKICSECHGSGIIRQLVKCKVGGHIFSQEKINLAATLPHCEIGILDGNLAVLRFDGGRGLLAYLRE